MAVGKKVSPARFIGALVGGVSNIIGGRKARGEAEEQQDIARAELEKQKQGYQDLDTSNIYANVKNQYANMENTMEDLTVNQQQAQFQAQQGAQQRSNIMQGLKGAAGGSGVAALAQQMANQGQLATQQASASIGQQESANQRAAAQQAGQIQTQERAGAVAAETQRLGGAADARGLEYGKQEGLLGMASGGMQAANVAKSAADQQVSSGWGQAIGGVASGLTGAVTGGLFGDKAGEFMSNITGNEYEALK